MSSDWLREDLWRVHICPLSFPWVGSLNLPWEGTTVDDRRDYWRDYDAVRWLDQLQSAHYETLVFYAKHHDGWTAYPSRYSALQPVRDYLGECVAEARRRGMRIEIYYSTVVDQIAGREHPDWRVVGRDGKSAAHGWFDLYWPGGAYLCINNPGYREFMLGQLSELRDNYHPDGFWLDVFEPLVPENCFCPHCREKYAAQTGGDLADTQGRAWYESCYVQLMAEIRELLKRDDPDCVLGHNTGVRLAGMENLMDFCVHEAISPTTLSLMCRALRSGDKPVEGNYRTYSECGCTWAMQGPERLLLEAMVITAHGAACCPALDVTPTGRIMDEPIARLAEVGAYVRAREPYLVDTDPVYDAALLQPAHGYGYVVAGVHRPAGWADVLVQRDIPYAILYPDADFSPYRLLILDDAVPCDEALARRLQVYVRAGGNLIVEAEAATFGTPAGEILSEVLGVRGLGEIGAPAPVAEEKLPGFLELQGQQVVEGLPEVLEEARDQSEIGSAHYLSDLDPRIAANLGEDDLVVEGAAWRIELTTAEPLGYFRYEFAARHPKIPTLHNLAPAGERSDDPALTLNAYGQGRAMYLACPLGTVEIREHLRGGPPGNDHREYPLQLAANLARLMVGEPVLEGTTPTGVEVVVNTQGQRHLVHLLNHYVFGYYHDNRRGLLRLARVPVSVNEHRLGRVSRALQVTEAGEQELSLERHGQWAEVTIPEVGVHEMLVLEH